MIVFYRTGDCPQCIQIQETLDQLAITYDVITGTAAELQKQLPSHVHPPALFDDGEIYQGANAILKHIEELEGFVEMWRKFQSDACYCDEDDGA